MLNKSRAAALAATTMSLVLLAASPAAAANTVLKVTNGVGAYQPGNKQLSAADSLRDGYTIQSQLYVNLKLVGVVRTKDVMYNTATKSIALTPGAAYQLRVCRVNANLVESGCKTEWDRA